MCVLYASLGSSVTSVWGGGVFMGSAVLSICRCSLWPYTAGSGVNSWQVVLSGLIMKLYFFHVCSLVTCLLAYVHVIIMSFAYEVKK